MLQFLTVARRWALLVVTCAVVIMTTLSWSCLRTSDETRSGTQVTAVSTQGPLVPTEVHDLGIPVLYPEYLPAGYSLLRIDREESNERPPSIQFVFGDSVIDGGHGGNYITLGLHRAVGLPPEGAIWNPHEAITVQGQPAFLLQGSREPEFSLTKGTPPRPPVSDTGEEIVFSPIDVLGVESYLSGFSVSLYAIPADSSDRDTVIRIAESLRPIGGT